MDARQIEQRVGRARFLSRMCMGMALISCTFMVVLVMTMVQMGSYLQVIPQLFTTIVGSDSMVHFNALDGFDVRLDYKDLNLRSLEWAFVQRFIEEKTFMIPDQTEMFRRWQPSGLLSSMAYATKEAFPPVYQKSDDRIKKVEMEQIVHAENIRFISVVNHVWTVLFDECVQRPSGSSCKKKQASVSVRIDRRRASRFYHPQYYYNPFGFVVERYHVQDMKI